jgi:hypothetical protein
LRRKVGVDEDLSGEVSGTEGLERLRYYYCRMIDRGRKMTSPGLFTKQQYTQIQRQLRPGDSVPIGFRAEIEFYAEKLKELFSNWTGSKAFLFDMALELARLHLAGERRKSLSE